MQQGIELANAGACGDPRVLVELSVLAEGAGWDGVFLEDYVVHHTASDAPTADPWTSLAAVAAQTQRIRIGTEVTPLSRRRPWMLARQVAAVDQLSNGRAVLGVGTGDVNDPGFAGVGETTDARERGAIVDEALEVIIGLWTGDPVHFSGTHFRVDGLTFRPRPVQRPHPPIWVGGMWPRSRVLQRAARFAQGVAVYKSDAEGFHLDGDEVRQLCARLENLRGRPLDGFDIVMGGTRRWDDVDQQRRHMREVADAGATWWVDYVAAGSYEEMRSAIAAGPLTL